MPEIKTIVIIGNGPSMKGVDLGTFDGVHTFGMKNAFRLFRKVGWWPTYYGCFDWVSTRKHAATFKELVEDPSVPVRTFFLLEKVSDSPRLCHVSFTLKGSYQFGETVENFGDGGNTAANCAQAAVCMGYNRILLIGVDLNWSHAPTSPGKYEVTDSAGDSDYFFEGYKCKGEAFNAPCPKEFHLPAWQAFAGFARSHGVSVINCSPISKLDCFPRSSLEAELATADLKT